MNKDQLRKELAEDEGASMKYTLIISVYPPTELVILW